MLSSPSSQPAGDGFAQFATEAGDGTGSPAAIGDYSGGETDFLVTCPENVLIKMNRVIVQYEDQGNFAGAVYGAGAALTNGISVLHLNDAGDIVRDWTSLQRIVANANWTRYCFDRDYLEFGVGNNYFGCRWTFGRSGAPITLRTGQSIAVRLRDDMSFLVDQTFNFQGVRIDES